MERMGSLVPIHTLTAFYAEDKFILRSLVNIIEPKKMVYKSVRDTRHTESYNYCGDFDTLMFSLAYNYQIQSITIPPDALALAGITKLDRSFLYHAPNLSPGPVLPILRHFHWTTIFDVLLGVDVLGSVAPRKRQGVW